jgi:HD-like signal output (HDOD) protein
VEQFWKRNTQLALAAAMIARRQYGISPDAAYTYTLFHDAAIPLMMKRFPNYGKVIEDALSSGKSLVEAEGEYFPCTHPIVGSLLVRNWGLPSILGQAIRFHHEHDVYEISDKSLPGGALSFIAVTQVAEHLAHEIMGENDHEVGSALYQKALAHLGISQEELDDLQACVAEAIGANA